MRQFYGSNDSANRSAPSISDNTTNFFLSATTGPINVLGSVTGGSLYTNGTYTGVALTGGTGVGAQGTVVVAAGAVSTVTVTNAGKNYTAADSLSATAASIGGTGSGFSVPVTSVFAGTTNVTIPAGADKVQLNASGPIVVNFNGKTAAVPSAASQASGVNGCELNPSVKALNVAIAAGVTTINIAAAGTVYGHASFFGSATPVVVG